jgi:hypothetical protein
MVTFVITGYCTLSKSNDNETQIPTAADRIELKPGFELSKNKWGGGGGVDICSDILVLKKNLV